MGVEDVNERAGYNSGASSPRSKVKFLCSHGGKILPRVLDGSLKYVGGETRVIAVPRDITFSELMKKLTAFTDGEMVLKYQLVTEDLDALVSVRTDEDVKHMFDEYDRNGGGGTPMLRAFLFPSKPVVLENQQTVIETHFLEQRYIDAINSIVRIGPRGRFSPARAFSISPACHSPKSPSPDDHTDYHEMILFNGPRNTQDPMHKVQSFSNICGLNSLNHSNGYGSLNMQSYDHSFYYNQNHPHGYPSSRMAQEPPMAAGRPPLSSPPGRADIGWLPLSSSPGRADVSWPPLSLSPGRADIGWPPLSSSPGRADIDRVHGFNTCYPTGRLQRGTGGYSMYNDACTGYILRAGAGSDPQSPRKRVSSIGLEECRSFSAREM